jgi:hypothetical protein
MVELLRYCQASAGTCASLNVVAKDANLSMMASLPCGFYGMAPRTPLEHRCSQNCEWTQTPTRDIEPLNSQPSLLAAPLVRTSKYNEQNPKHTHGAGQYVDQAASDRSKP